MWVWLENNSEPENIFIPANEPSSNGEYESLRQEISYYWHAVERFIATGDTSKLDRFAGSHLTIDGRVYFFQRDLDELEQAGQNAELAFDDIESGGGQ